MTYPSSESAILKGAIVLLTWDPPLLRLGLCQIGDCIVNSNLGRRRSCDEEDYTNPGADHRRQQCSRLPPRARPCHERAALARLWRCSHKQMPCEGKGCRASFFGASCAMPFGRYRRRRVVRLALTGAGGVHPMLGPHGCVLGLGFGVSEWAAAGVRECPVTAKSGLRNERTNDAEADL